MNDRDGNPIEISAVVVWKVTDTAEALFASYRTSWSSSAAIGTPNPSSITPIRRWTPSHPHEWRRFERRNKHGMFYNAIDLIAGTQQGKGLSLNAGGRKEVRVQVLDGGLP